MQHQNWNETTLKSKKKQTSKQLQKQALTDNKKIKVMKKHKGTGKNMAKIMDEDNLEIPHLSQEFKIAMSQARNSIGMKQKELA